MGLLSLGYPPRVLKSQREKAMKFTQGITGHVNTFNELANKKIFFVTTRNELSLDPRVGNIFKMVTDVLKLSPFFSIT